MNIQAFKADIKTTAVNQRWPMSQIQYGEDYIDALIKRGPAARPPKGLEKENAAFILREFKEKTPS